MATGQPLPAARFNIGDSIFLLASAKKGFREEYTVEQLRNTGGRWKYALNVRSKQGKINFFSVTDRYTLQESGSLEFNESELLTECEALDYIISHHQTLLASYIARKSSLACDGSG